MITHSSIKKINFNKRQNFLLYTVSEVPLLASLPASWLSSVGTCCWPHWECHHFHWSKQDCFCFPGLTHGCSELLFFGFSFCMSVRCRHKKAHVCNPNKTRTNNCPTNCQKTLIKGFTSSETGRERSKNISVTTDTCKCKVIAI